MNDPVTSEVRSLLALARGRGGSMRVGSMHDATRKDALAQIVALGVGELTYDAKSHTRLNPCDRHYLLGPLLTLK